MFVIHGHDVKARDELVKIISEAGFTPVLLKDQPMQGARTLIEKFEIWAPLCNYAIALMSPDDKTFNALKGRGDERFTARQNVFIELGWFMGQIGRERVYIVVKGSVDIPSDIVGVEVIRCKSRVAERAEDIKNMLTSNRKVRRILHGRAR